MKVKMQFSRLAALFLIFTLIQPSPTFAMRVQNGGDSENTTAKLTTGLEERTIRSRFAKGAALGATAAAVTAAGYLGYQKLTAPAPQQSAPQAHVVPLVPGSAQPAEKSAQASSRKVVWVLNYHGVPGDFESLVAQLRNTRGPVVLVLEAGPLRLRNLRNKHLGIAQQLTMKKLNELVQLLNENGEDAFLKDSLGAALKEILVQYWGRRAYEGYRGDPSTASPLFRPLMEELKKRKDVKLDREQAPLISFLNQLRADLSEEEVAQTFFKDQRASLRTLVEHLHFQQLSVEQRDQALGKERLPLILRANPEATAVLISLGVGHLQGGSFAEVYRDLGFKEEVVSADDLGHDLKILKPHRGAFLKGQTAFAEQADVRRELLRYLPYRSLFALLTEFGTSAERDRQATEMLGTMKDDEIQTFLKGLQIRTRQEVLGTLASQSYDRWLGAMGFYTLAWLNENGKLTPAMKVKLPKEYWDLSLGDVDRILLVGAPRQDMPAIDFDAGIEPGLYLPSPAQVAPAQQGTTKGGLEEPVSLLDWDFQAAAAPKLRVGSHELVQLPSKGLLIPADVLSGSFSTKETTLGIFLVHASSKPGEAERNDIVAGRIQGFDFDDSQTPHRDSFPFLVFWRYRRGWPQGRGQKPAYQPISRRDPLIFGWDPVSESDLSGISKEQVQLSVTPRGDLLIQEMDRSHRGKTFLGLRSLNSIRHVFLKRTSQMSPAVRQRVERIRRRQFSEQEEEMIENGMKALTEAVEEYLGMGLLGDRKGISKKDLVWLPAQYHAYFRDDLRSAHLAQEMTFIGSKYSPVSLEMAPTGEVRMDLSVVDGKYQGRYLYPDILVALMMRWNEQGGGSSVGFAEAPIAIKRDVDRSKPENLQEPGVVFEGTLAQASSVLHPLIVPPVGQEPVIQKIWWSEREGSAAQTITSEADLEPEGSSLADQYIGLTERLKGGRQARFVRVGEQGEVLRVTLLYPSGSGESAGLEERNGARPMVEQLENRSAPSTLFQTSAGILSAPAVPATTGALIAAGQPQVQAAAQERLDADLSNADTRSAIVTLFASGVDNAAPYLGLSDTVREAGYPNGMIGIVPSSRLREASIGQSVLVAIDIQDAKSANDVWRNLKDAVEAGQITLTSLQDALVVIGDENTHVGPRQALIRVNAKTASSVTLGLLNHLQEKGLLKAGSIVVLYKGDFDEEVEYFA